MNEHSDISKEEEKLYFNENHELENYRDQLRQLEVELDMAENNKEMFYRLWLKWENEHMDIERAIDRLNTKIKNTPQ